MKTMKKLLSVALVVAMVLTMVMIPVNAETAKKTVVLMYDGMDTQPLSNILGMSADNADLIAYNKGNVWGSKGEYNTKVFDASTGNFVIKADPSVKFDDYIIRKQLFGNYPAQTDTDVRFVYEFKTGTFCTGEYFRVISRLRDNDGKGTKDFNFFTYDAHSGKIKNGTAAQDTYVLTENTDYKITIDLKKRAASGFTYVFTMADANGNSSITSGSSKVSEVSTYQTEWYTGEIPNTSYLDEINFHLLSSNTTYTKNVDLLTIKTVKVLNFVDVENETEGTAKTFTVMDDDMSAVNNKYYTQSRDLVNLDGTAGRDENSYEYKLYHGGDVWAKIWASDSGSFSTDSNGMLISAKTDNTYEDGKESSVLKKPFAKFIEYTGADLRVEYEIKTASKFINSLDSSVDETSGSVSVQSVLDEATLFNYSPETMQIAIAAEKIKLEENSKYKLIFNFKYDDENQVYDMICSIVDGDGVEFKTVGAKEWGVFDLNFDTILTVRYYRNKQIVKNASLLTFENIKIDEIIDGNVVKIDDAQYNENEKVMIDCTDNADVSGAVSLSNEEYLNGTNWGITHPEKLETAFKENGDTIALYSTHTKNELVELKKKFEPIADGEVLKAEGKFFINHTKADSANALAWYFKIGLSGSNSDLNMLSYKSTAYWNYLSLLHEGNFALWDNPEDNSQTVSIVGTGKNGDVINKNVDYFKVGDVPNCGANSSYLDGTVDFELFATPDSTDSSKYNLVLNLKGDSIDVTATKTVDKSYIMGMSDITVGMIEKRSATEEVFRVSDIKVSKYPSEGKNAFVKGANSIYLPVYNLTGNKATYAIVAAVCDKATDKQKDFYIQKYTDYAVTLDNLKVDVNIGDPINEYIRVFIFNEYDKLVPYSTSKLIGK